MRTADPHVVRTSMLVLLGGGIGLVVATAVYRALNPLLEESTGPLRETQGLLWNLVPLLTVLGMLLGWWLASRRSR